MADIETRFGRGIWRCAVNRVKVAVAIGEEALDRIHEVAEACRVLGFRHDSTLVRIGVLVGSVEAGDLARLRAVPGVTAVEIEREFQHGRPPNPS